MEEVHTIAVTADAKFVVSGSYKKLNVWSLKDASFICRIEGHPGERYALAVTPECCFVVSDSDRDPPRLWDLRARKCIHYGNNSVTPTGALVVATRLRYGWAPRNSLKVWDLIRGEVVHLLECESYRKILFAMTPDSRMAVSGLWNGALVVWDLETAQKVRCLNYGGFGNSVSALALTADGRFVVSSLDDIRTIHLWDVETGGIVRYLNGHGSTVRSLAATPDGCLGVSGSEDKVVIVWDLATGKIVCSFRGESAILSCAITHDGRTVVAGEASGRIHWYNAPQKELQRLGIWQRLEQIAGRSLVWKEGWTPESGSLLVGSKGIVHTNAHNSLCTLLPIQDFPNSGGLPQKLPHVEGHLQEWIQACKGGPLPLSNFDHAGPVVELLLVGNVATLVGQSLEFDPVAMKVINNAEADALLRPEYR